KVFVATTPISGPTCRYRVAAATCVRLLSTTLVMATVRAPAAAAHSAAASVSAVSPDWLTAMNNTRSSRGGGAYRNSDAIAVSTRSRSHSSQAYLATMQA